MPLLLHALVPFAPTPAGTRLNVGLIAGLGPENFGQGWP